MAIFWYNLAMITKEIRSKIMEKYVNKDDKMLAASIIDLSQKFESNNYVVHTSFLNIYEKQIAVSILNYLDVKYIVYSPTMDAERVVIFFIPEYLEEENLNDIFEEYVTCIKITPPSKVMLKHKDYMGAILNAGTSEKMIGDIYALDGSGYVFMMKTLENYYLNNLLYVSKNEVSTKALKLNSKEVLSLNYSFSTAEITIPSNRVDAILSNVYNLSRNEVKTKIEDGDLIINAREMFFMAYETKIGDIISFRKCGKFKIGNILRTTRSGNIVIEIKKYI